MKCSLFCALKAPCTSQLLYVFHCTVISFGFLIPTLWELVFIILPVSVPFTTKLCDQCLPSMRRVTCPPLDSSFHHLARFGQWNVSSYDGLIWTRTSGATLRAYLLSRWDHAWAGSWWVTGIYGRADLLNYPSRGQPRERVSAEPLATSVSPAKETVQIIIVQLDKLFPKCTHTYNHHPDKKPEHSQHLGSTSFPVITHLVLQR